MEIFTRIINGWKSLPIVMKISILDIGGARGSTAAGESNTVLDLKLKFTMLFITHFGTKGEHQILEKVSTIKN